MLIRCPECKQQISEQATPCPKCGRPISDEDRAKAKANAKVLQIGCIGSSVAIALAIVLALWISASTSPPRPRTGTAHTQSVATGYAPDNITAWVMAEQFVKGQLRSPGTASFGSAFREFQSPDDHVTYLGDRRYRVAGWVDAENAFGATVRTNFVCILRDVDGENWRAEDVTITAREGML